MSIAHTIVAVEGPQPWYDLFLYDLEKQQYTYRATHNQVGIIGPMIREIHLLDITVPEQNLGDLLSDLAPYTNASSKQKASAILIKKAIWLGGKVSSFFKGTKLKPIPDAKPSGNIRKKALNIMPLFWFEDRVVENPGLILPLKGKKGELL